jgi:hypothetical protein
MPAMPAGSGAPVAAAFRPLTGALAGKGMAPAENPMSAMASPVAVLPSTTDPAGSQHSHEQIGPIVTARRDGDKITHIIVRCACGAVTELECLY